MATRPPSQTGRVSRRIPRGQTQSRIPSTAPTRHPPAPGPSVRERPATQRNISNNKTVLDNQSHVGQKRKDRDFESENAPPGGPKVRSRKERDPTEDVYMREKTPAQANAAPPQPSSPKPQSLTPSTKKKERVYDQADDTHVSIKQSEKTNIHVVVRCRGRSEREVQENSGVVVSTEGIKSNNLELSMGPNALGNKAYHFDRVFSPAADQAIVFDDVVIPALNEMLGGFNCTVFAYGQTGTGKTYTMSGDMTDTLGILSDAAGIAPRVLYALFQKLEDREASVKCSFLELYNEELRDLLSPDDSAKLKIFDDAAKKGYNSTMVQGISETYIHSASAGIKLLQEGSHKRQVAATKCNDLSSRSHTVFTLTAYIKRTNDKGDEFITSGKLNLVDLAGSENIQRSGAENKRATEAGLINKSLLTLGRVINALVDGSHHIPYRESKLTRLLQDSLGGHTKTYIIATITSARANLEETMSTLDYAFRAKNIRNKPQLNSAFSKKTILREFTVEIEKLKSELIATRLRNGVYLPPDQYEAMTIESESRRILTEEQRARIETMEANLKHKVQELLSLTGNFNSLKDANDQTRQALKHTENLLEQTDIVLASTKKSLEEETELRKAHEKTEQELHTVGTQLVKALDKSSTEMDALHAKIQMNTDLQSSNRRAWNSSIAEVVDVAKAVDDSVAEIQFQQSKFFRDFSSSLKMFMQNELKQLDLSRSLVSDSETIFGKEASKAKDQTTQSCEEMDNAFGGMNDLQKEITQSVNGGLSELNTATAQITEGVIHEVADYQTQIQSSFSSLGSNFKSILERVQFDIQSQERESRLLREQLQAANERASRANEIARDEFRHMLAQERKTAETERRNLLSNVKDLLEQMAEKQTTRVETGFGKTLHEFEGANDCLQESHRHYNEQMDICDTKKDSALKSMSSSKDRIERDVDEVLRSLRERHESLGGTARTAQNDAERLVQNQMHDLSVQMQALDDSVMRVRLQNASHHTSRMETLDNLTNKIHQSYIDIGAILGSFGSSTQGFCNDISGETQELQTPVVSILEEIRKSLVDLQESIQAVTIEEYESTGKTPKPKKIDYPKSLPKTKPHDNILGKLRAGATKK